MKKLIGVVLIVIGFLTVFVERIGPTKETKFLFQFGSIPLLIVALVLLVGGLVLYRNRN